MTLIFSGLVSARFAGRVLQIIRVRVKWGRVLLGAYLIFAQVRNHYHPPSNLLQPSNEIQANGMRVAAMALVLVAVWLLVSGVISAFKPRASFEEVSKIAP
ncbi:MAG TPA: hypothetical protein VHS80_10130 [Chthoniobacterales bacterium]|nr:hypothetical protein [Chthoniobacterales bacterium]